MHRYAVEGVPDVVHDESPEARAERTDDDADRPLSFAY
jgi:cytochrome d ubiquinol oxidase subunit I